jgi:prepilin signal peptidase PulO-like enzyme (type II secretory pathway)
MTPLLAMSLAPAISMGAIIGSFMSVVAVRVPRLVLDSPGGRVRLTRLLSSLSWPGSHCTSCNASLRWRDNIPLLSYLVLRGRCRKCHCAYGSRYFLLEAGGAAAGLASAWLFGWSVQGVLCFLFLSLLLVLSIIDLEEMLLPDVLVFPLLPLGLAYQSWYGAGPVSACLGAVAAFAVMWAIGASYRLARKADGLGGGDVKLAGALGAWLGIANIPFFLIGAFASGLIVMTAFLLISKSAAKNPLPFGPFLALSAAVIVLIPQATAYLTDLLAY